MSVAFMMIAGAIAATVEDAIEAVRYRIEYRSYRRRLCRPYKFN